MNTNQVKWWSFEERGNQSTQRKPLGAEKKTNKLNLHMMPDLGIEPRPHWWEASALTTVPSLHPGRLKINNDNNNNHKTKLFFSLQTSPPMVDIQWDKSGIVHESQQQWSLLLCLITLHHVNSSGRHYCHQ